jgi:putative nucleotidyltransferase with HDIG domain
MSESLPAGYIGPEQLCIGLHVVLDLPWTDHPFPFSSFKIKGPEQIEIMRSLGLTRIRYLAAKSDAQPLPAQAAAEAAAPAAVSAVDVSQAISEAKRERIARLAAQHARIEACEREFLQSSRAFKSINQNLFARPEMAREEADTLIKAMADSMLTDAEVAINLMKDRMGADETYHHALNVTVLSLMLAKELKAPVEAIKVMGLAALFHDVGKHDLPDRIVRKTDPLTKPEQDLLHQHCAYGVVTARKLGLSHEAQLVIAQHHERVDGGGYPGGLKGPEISMLARIVAVTNAFDNLCNPPNPARALTPHEALSVMYGQQRGQFEALPLSTFIRCMGIYPPGTVVVLSNDTMAMVVSVNSARPLKPTVLVYDPAVPKDQAILVDLEQVAEVSIARTIKPQQLPEAVFDYLSPKKRLAFYFDSARPGA